MRPSRFDRLRAVLIWAGLLAIFLFPLAAAGSSPLLAWRDPVYIIAGFAGILALCLVVMQLLLIGGGIPGAKGIKGRRIHKWVGLLLVATVLLHVVGLWITSPPDVIDALLFRSPTPFSAWGVAAMWSVLAAAVMLAFRRRLSLNPGNWRRIHVSLALVTSLGTVVHALLIQGTMETISKVLVSLLLLMVMCKVVLVPMVKNAWKHKSP